MIQNTQIKNPKMAVLSVDVVWTVGVRRQRLRRGPAGRSVPDRPAC